MTQIINSTTADLAAIAACHKKAFPHSLSSGMGIKFLTKMLDWYLCNDYAFLFHMENNGKIAGYCGGIKVDGTQPTGSASGMAQHSFQMAVISFIKRPWLLFHPEVRKKYKLIARNIVYKLHIKKPARRNISTSKEPVYVGLVVIGIDPVFQGKGYSKIILDEFEKRGRSMGVSKLRLTVLPDNNTAIRAYRKSGWKEDIIANNSVSMSKIIK
jgi:ribosomal protein S18 acetylase RimI-like enzyme